MGRNRITDRWKPFRADIDVQHNLRECSFFVAAVEILSAVKSVISFENRLREKDTTC